MKNNCGVEIGKVDKGGIAGLAGLKPGDKLLAINGNKIRDIIDLMFYGTGSEYNFLVQRDKKPRTVSIDISDLMHQNAGFQPFLGLEVKPFKIRTCGNNCIFCFVLQLPKGLRRPLYVKDEDYRMSFLYGNYITMTNLTEVDRKRIVEERLSPLYLSVHSTDTAIRNRMLGNQRAADILKELKFLADNKIRMHVQVVLCPGYNDGLNLKKTIGDLYKFYPYVMSIAIVPVGLTAHRKKGLTPVEKEDAEKALETIHKFQARFKRRHGEQVVYGADELYIKAGIKFPPLEYYGELPQIENGVGMVPLFIHQAKKIKMPQAMQNIDDKTKKKGKEKKQRFITFTGISFYPYLWKYAEKLRKSGIDIEVVAVENAFFGKSVTVTGLLTGRDVIKSLTDLVRKDDVLLIPDVVMREGDEIFLDDVSRKDMEDILDLKAVIIDSSPQGVLDAVRTFL